MPTFSEIVTRVEELYFGRFGVHGLSEDDRMGMVKLYVDQDKKAEFEDQILPEITRALQPYFLRVIYEPRPTLWAIAD